MLRYVVSRHRKHAVNRIVTLCYNIFVVTSMLWPGRYTNLVATVECRTVACVYVRIWNSTCSIGCYGSSVAHEHLQLFQSTMEPRETSSTCTPRVSSHLQSVAWAFSRKSKRIKSQCSVVYFWVLFVRAFQLKFLIRLRSDLPSLGRNTCPLQVFRAPT